MTATKWRVEKDSTGDPLLSMLPLEGAVAHAVAAELIRDGFANRCGECGGQFNAALKRRAVARVRFMDAAGVLYTTTWVLCGKCRREAVRRGAVSDKLLAEARAAAPEGNA